MQIRKIYSAERKIQDSVVQKSRCSESSRSWKAPVSSSIASVIILHILLLANPLQVPCNYLELPCLCSLQTAQTLWNINLPQGQSPPPSFHNLWCVLSAHALLFVLPESSWFCVSNSCMSCFGRDPLQKLSCFSFPVF